MRSLSRPVRTALIGCGMIADEYATTLASSSMVTLSGCADIRDDKARAFAQRHHLRHAAVTDLLHPAVTDIAVILTPPASHADIAHAAIRAGVPGIYAEKPLATSPGQAHALTCATSQAGVLLCAAPDTILGAPTQAALAAINGGLLGDVIGASASYLSSGPERWHPAPEPFHTADAGPLADMGPYYLGQPCLPTRAHRRRHQRGHGNPAAADHRHRPARRRGLHRQRPDTRHRYALHRYGHPRHLHLQL